MSKVISFRLDHTNPVEAQALAVLSAWVEKGFSVRFILTKALIVLDKADDGLDSNQDHQNISLVIDRADQLLDMVQALKGDVPCEPEHLPENSNLHVKFIVPVRQMLKPGIKLE